MFVNMRCRIHSLYRTDQSLVEKKVHSRLGGKACSASKVLGHQWSVDTKMLYDMIGVDGTNCKWFNTRTRTGTERTF